jgi:hypothetical protein
MGAYRFGAPRELILWMREAYGMDTFIETGTNKAETSMWAAGAFGRVITVEGYEPLYRSAVAQYGSTKNIEFLLGNSPAKLREIIPTLTTPAIFWLDAHWCGTETFGLSAECPVLEEIQIINGSSLPHVLLVDDARLFLAPPPPPHVTSHWPDIRQVCDALGRDPFDRYVCVHEDVIIGVSPNSKDQLIEYIRTQLAAEIKRENDIRQSRLKSVLHRLRQVFQPNAR